MESRLCSRVNLALFWKSHPSEDSPRYTQYYAVSPSGWWGHGLCPVSWEFWKLFAAAFGSPFLSLGEFKPCVHIISTQGKKNGTALQMVICSLCHLPSSLFALAACSFPLCLLSSAPLLGTTSFFLLYCCLKTASSPSAGTIVGLPSGWSFL